MIALYLLVFAGFCKAVCDALYFRFDRSLFTLLPLNVQCWLDPQSSWQLKWAVDENGHTILKPRFPGADTFLVWLTDGWHFFQMLQYSALVAAIILYEPIVSAWWMDAVLLKCSMVVTFELFFRWGFIRKTYGMA